MAPWPPTMMMMASMSNSWSIFYYFLAVIIHQYLWEIYNGNFECCKLPTCTIVQFCYFYHHDTSYIYITINRCLISAAHDYGMLERMKIICQWLHSLGKKALIPLTYITQSSSCRKSWRVAWAGGCLVVYIAHTSSLSQRPRQWQVL